jgi:DNA sulfur modification protein DndD
MLRLSKLRLENFGPYKGEQEIAFPSNDGVVLVYGENMRGKTTLLNAFRYALFGRFIGRGQAQIPIHKIGNWEAAEEGSYGFKVELEFTFGPDLYVLTRTCKPLVPKPKDDSGYERESFLTKNGQHLNQDQAQHTLLLLMPEDVSRFFLFDGELLQQYEELLRDDSVMGQQIKIAIERILGVPIVTNGRSDLLQIKTKVAQTEAKVAAADQKTHQLGAQSKVLLDKQEGHRKEVVRLKADHADLRQRKLVVEEGLRRFEKIKTLFVERDRLADNLKDIASTVTSKRERLKELMADSWRVVLAGRFKVRERELGEELSTLRVAEEKRAYATRTKTQLERSLERGKCATCGHSLAVEEKAEIQSKINDYVKEMAGPPKADDVFRVEKILVGLREMTSKTSPELIAEIEEQIDAERVKEASAKSKIEEILEQTRNADESEVRRLQSDYDRIVRDMTLTSQGIQREEKELGDATFRLQKVQDDLKKHGTPDLAKHRKRRELIQRLQELFASGVDAYREKLRRKVETDATDLFLQLTTEEEYSGLSINENYGLEIVHKSGQPISIRSAGAEHIVALSLMGSLQKNAPLQGPIIMDSPFGRLDSAHTRKVVDTLPNMASQVILLVYESELEPELARSALREQLRREYRISRKSARHSLLEKQI